MLVATTSLAADSTRAVARRDEAFAHLNAQQREAVGHGLEGGHSCGAPLLVIAGAGTGKTLTLASRAAALVLAGADPQRLLLLTFSRRAEPPYASRPSDSLQPATPPGRLALPGGAVLASLVRGIRCHRRETG